MIPRIVLAGIGIVGTVLILVLLFGWTLRDVLHAWPLLLPLHASKE